MTAASLIERHRLEPHPFEGYWRQTAHTPGLSRQGLQLMSGLDEAGWHSFDAEITYAFVEGGPATIALSQNGRSAYGHRLMAPGDSLKIGPGVLRTLSCLGAYTLLQLTLEPDVALTDRQLAPDDWVPGPGGRPQW